MDLKTINNNGVTCIMDDAEASAGWGWGWFYGLPVSGTPEAEHLQVKASADDATESSTGLMSINLTTSSVTVEGGWYAVRFQDVRIPPRAKVVTAKMRLYAGNTAADDAQFDIYGELAANAAAFSATDFDISSRSRSTASVNWSAVDAAGAAASWVTLPDLSPVLQEIFNQSAWASGNALALIFDALTGVSFTFRHWDFDPTWGTRLEIEWRSLGLPPFRKQTNYLWRR
jgi:hypothetical protein